MSPIFWSPGRAVSAQPEETGTSTGEDSVVDVIKISGFLDEIMADFIETSIDRAVERGSIGLTLQVNSTRAVVSDPRLVELAARIVESEVPVSMWVGPSGAKALGGTGQLAAVVADLALAPGSRIGDLGDPILPRHRLESRFGAAYGLLRDGTIGSEAAIEQGLVREAPTLGYFVIGLDGFETAIDDTGDEPVRVPLSSVRFNDLSLVHEVLHTVASPAVTYLLFLAGGGLIVFELFTAGVGLAGGVGAVAFLLSSYGLGVLPARGWAVGLLVVALFGYAVDIQAGAPRVWTVIATTCLLIGSLTLFDRTSISWITLGAGIASLVTAMVFGMPVMVRTRFGIPTIGREWMIGEMGTARDRIEPEGVVVIRATPWQARTNRATPVPAGDPVRVVAIDGLILEVEPAQGGARDYRDRRRS